MSYKNNMAALAKAAIVKIDVFNDELKKVESLGARYSQQYQNERIAEVVGRKDAYIKDVTMKATNYFMDYKKKVEARYMLNGNDIDDGGMKLLKCELITTSDELDRFIEKYIGNYTMVELGRKYGLEKNIHINVVVSNKEDELKAGERLYKYLQSTLTSPQTFATIWTGSNFAKITAGVADV